MKTLRVTVVEDLVERTTIDIEVEDNFDLDAMDDEAVDDFCETAFTAEAYKEVPLTKEYDIRERYFTDVEVLP